jgi:hypothetical protein
VDQQVGYVRAANYVVTQRTSLSLSNEGDVIEAELNTVSFSLSPTELLDVSELSLNSAADRVLESEISYGPVADYGGPTLNCAGQGILFGGPVDGGLATVASRSLEHLGEFLVAGELIGVLNSCFTHLG